LAKETFTLLRELDKANPASSIRPAAKAVDLFGANAYLPSY